MFPPLPTTPFRNSPSIDALSPRTNHFPTHNRTSSSALSQSVIPEREESGAIEIVGDATIGTDVPVSLLRSVILACSPSIHPSTPTLNLLQTPVLSGLNSPLAIGSADHPPHSHLQSQSDSAPPWNTSTIAYTPAQVFPPIRHLPGNARKRILVTGGAGFVGSHLVDRLMFMGHDVTVLDNFFSGSKTAVAHWMSVGHPNFELIRHDVVDPFMIECDQIYHLACPASPVAYQYNSIKTMKTNFLGTMNMLGLAKRTKARFLLSSTSEIYGSPEQHPQKETYWGNVNPIGPRACYDEGKRVAEALTYGYARENGVDVRVARIFNTYGPRMSPSDGRLVSNFIMHAIRGESISIYGDGKQTRCLMYIFDLIDGLINLMNSDDSSLTDSPVNLGTTDEKTVLDWAHLILKIVNHHLHQHDHHHHQFTHHLTTHDELNHLPEIVHLPGLLDDPPRRKPDTSKAHSTLNWFPKWSAEAGLEDTVKFFLGMFNSGYVS